MGICEDAPDEYCGHILEPADVGVEQMMEMYGDWHKDTQSAICLRAPKYDGLCVWHADTDQKTAEELVEARVTPEDVPWDTDYVKEHLSGAMVREIEFPDGFSFGGCIIAGANFSGSDLEAVDFSGAYLAFSEFSDTDLLFAEFSDVNLHNSKFFDSDLIEAGFPRANLSSAKFVKSNLHFAAFINANLYHATFSGVKIQEAEFPYSEIQYAKFSDTNLFRAEFPNADLQNSQFINANLFGAEFSGANLQGANLTQSNLREAEFSGANLREIKLKPACSREVDVKTGLPDTSFENIPNMPDSLGASLEDAQFENGTDLRGANLSGARLYQAAFRDVRINDETIFGFDDNSQYGEKCRYEYDLNTGVSIDEDTSRLKAAAWTYRRLESLFEENAMDERARNAHIRKEETQRAHQAEQIRGEDWLKSLGEYAVSTANWHLHRHGESLRRLLGASGLLIFLCGIVYAGAGIARSSPETTYRITLADLVQPVAFLSDLLNGIYFSIITFSTIGYGDFYPASPLSQLLVGIESLAGALFIALFVFVIGRRVAR